MSAANRNMLAAEILADELARAGLRHVCLAPGSRNTPLVLALAAHPQLQSSSHLDERSAAFFALGIGLATGQPAAVVCTSGSAAANFFPAIVEAHQAQVPLLVLTADRPPELHFSGANQTIEQQSMFGHFALWSVDVALPEAQPPALVLRSLRALAGRAVATAVGPRAGVVHLNLPLRAPLEPTVMAGDLGVPPPDALPRPENLPQTRFVRAAALPAPELLDELAALIAQHEQGLIVCGPRSPGGSFGPLVAALAERAGYPLLADGVSGLRFGLPGVIGGYDSFLPLAAAAPTLVLRFGAVPTSKALGQYLDRATAASVVHVRADGVWADDSYRVSLFVQADEAALVRALLPAIRPRQSAWATHWAALEAGTWQAVAEAMAEQPLFDAAAVYEALELAPPDSTLFVGNSLAVRHLDQFGRPGARPLAAYANRGASGIDGNLSTALGLGYARTQSPLLAIVGDITFYHDMNGLLAARRCGVPVTVLLLHNDGGGIFRRLPISNFEPAFGTYFLTPHGLDFAPAAQLYGLRYKRVEDRAGLRQALAASLAVRDFALIEVRSDSANDLARRQAIMTHVAATLRDL